MSQKRNVTLEMSKRNVILEMSPITVSYSKKEKEKGRTKPPMKTTT